MDRDQQEPVSIPDLAWQAQGAASEDSVVADSTAEEADSMVVVAGSTVAVEAAGFMEVEAGSTVGDR